MRLGPCLYSLHLILMVIQHEHISAHKCNIITLPQFYSSSTRRTRRKDKPRDKTYVHLNRATNRSEDCRNMMKLPRTRGINTNRRAYDNHIHVSFLSFTPRLHQHRRRCTQFAKSRPAYRCSFDNSTALSGGGSKQTRDVTEKIQLFSTLFYHLNKISFLRNQDSKLHEIYRKIEP